MSSRLAGLLIVGMLSAGTSALAAPTTTTGSGYIAYGPTRFLDTRTGSSPSPVAPFGTVRLAVGGTAGIPAGITAVIMNVTVTNPTDGGFVTVYPDGADRPLASNLNFTAGRMVPNLTTVPVGANGFVDLYNGSAGTTDLIADVTGYYTSSEGAGYVPTEGFRMFDTRTGAGPVPAGGVLTLTMSGMPPIPRNATAVALNVTVTGPQAPGFVTVYPTGASRPTTSNLNYIAGQDIANAVIVPFGQDGKINFYSHATTHLVVDVAGFFVPGNRNLFVPVTPVRKVDTRNVPGPIPARSERAFQLMAGVLDPALHGVAVVFNATVVNPQASGFLSAWATSPFPSVLTSSVNFTAGSIVPNLVITELNDTGSETFHNGSDGNLDLVVDVSGYFATF